MPKLAPLKPLEIERILLKNNFVMNTSKSGHRQYFNPTSKAHTTVPFHSKTIPIGTLRSIVRQSLLSINLFRR